MAEQTQPLVRALHDLSRSDGTTATFHAGMSGQTHQWKIRTPAGVVLAETVRVHRGGTIRRTLWTLWNQANMHVGDDIYVELRGADGTVLGKVFSDNATPAVVVVSDESGARVAKSVRKKKTLKVFGVDDEVPIATLDLDGDGPWQIIDPEGDALGELLAGRPDPSRKPGLAEWALFTDVALNAAAHRKGQHLGIRRVVRYSYAPLGRNPTPLALALLPLLAGLTY